MQKDFDVIVVGSGVSGGWVAKEMCERGFKTLVIDRGTPLEHAADYKTEGAAPWDMPNRGKVNEDELEADYAYVKKCYAFSEYTKDHFIKDSDYPFSTPKDQGFDWIRSATVGGKSLLWHRQSYRFGPVDFESNKEDGFGCDWPIRYDDIAPWYDKVEHFAGISGNNDGIPHLPDGVFQKPFDMLQVEKDAKARIEAAFPERKLIMGRCAHLTEPTEEQLNLGRGPCQARNECQRGCSWGGYFSSLSATLPAADRTNNLTVLPSSLVQEVLYDAKTGTASGVRAVDTINKVHVEITARTVFVCASALSSNHILLNSRSSSFPSGIGNRHDVLGRYIADHVLGAGATADVEGYEDLYYSGRRPTGLYMPRFQNLTESKKPYLRGFGFQGGAHRESWYRAITMQGIGPDFKKKMRQPGKWRFTLMGYGETLPRAENRVTLHPSQKDTWGMPLLHIDCKYSENEELMRQDMVDTAIEMLTAAGFKNIAGFNHHSLPGLSIHEMGGARMGHRPEESYLNKFNQCHDVPNLFVTDGASMASVAYQNPSLTFMALSARAAHYAADKMQSGAL